MSAGTGRARAIKEDSFHRIDWRVRRVARVVFALVLLAALLGVFGDGPLARTKVASGSVSVEYDRFLRDEEVVRVRFPAGGGVRLKVRGLIDAGEKLECVPSPVRDESRVGERVLEFAPDPERDEIDLSWEVRRAGVRRGFLEVDGTRLEAWALVYP